MAQQTINVGAAPNDGTGTPLRTAFQYTNSNFSELYTALGGGVGLPGATTQVIFNDGGTNLAGDAGLVYNKTTDALTIGGNVQAGSATITGALTVDSSTLVVDPTNDYVGIGTASPVQSLTISGEASLRVGDVFYWNGYYNAGFKARAAGYAAYISESGTGDLFFANTASSAAGAGSSLSFLTRYNIDKDGVATWQNVGGVAGTAMTLNANGLGIGVTPSAWRNTQKALQVGAVGTYFSSAASTGSTCIGRNVYESTAGNFTYIVNDEATFYEQTATGNHAWYTAAAGTGTIAFGDAKMTLDASGNLILLSSSTPATLTTNGQLTVNATSDTNLRFSYRGSDGVTRTANLTLAP